MSIPSPSDALLARYVAGECSAEEAVEVERWAAMDSAHRASLETFRALWNARQPDRAWDADRIWSRVRGTMRAQRPRHATRWVGLAARIAAALALVAGGGLTLLYLADHPSAPARAPVPAREYATARGQRATLQLPDGSRLVLAPASRLRIPADFGRGARDVLLEGEALFDVVHDSTRPFRVLAKDAVAHDLGTRFSVRAYPEDSVVAVAVAEGSVALGRRDVSDAAAHGVVLQHGELGALSPAGRVATTRGNAVAAYLSWADGRLVFVDTPLHEAVARLSRWYDIDIRLQSPDLGARRLTATFVYESAPEALQFIGTVLGLGTSRVGNVYTLGG